MPEHSNFSGCATISGIAVLENARGVSDDSKLKNTILFDAQLWVHDEFRFDGSPIIASLKYYNSDANLSFRPDEVGIYFIVANVCTVLLFFNVIFLLTEKTQVAKAQNEPSICSPGMECSDYAIVGDIIMVSY